jgi:hypothetical protein
MTTNSTCAPDEGRIRLLVAKKHFRLMETVEVVGSYIAPSGHNRLQSVDLNFTLSPDEMLTIHSETFGELGRYVFKPASDALIEELIRYMPHPIIGFSIDSVSIDPVQVDWATADASVQAGLAAAKNLIALASLKPSILDFRDGGN